MKINLLKAGLGEITHNDPEKLKIVLIHIVKVVIQHFKVVRIIETKTCLFHRIMGGLPGQKTWGMGLYLKKTHWV